MIEIWKSVNGFHGLYEISNYGRVWSVRSNRILSSKDHCGYRRVSLVKNKKQSLLLVHRLVAKAFIENTDNKKVVNHKNGIKDDNRVSNLEWVTQGENIKHAYDIGLSSRAGKKNTNFKGTVVATSILTGEKIFMNGAYDMHCNGFDHSRVSRCLLGKLNKHKNHTFERLKLRQLKRGDQC